MFFTDQEIQEAVKLRDLGLTWKLEPGLYIWDEQGQIIPGSPFQHGVYFLLEVDCFVEYFGDRQALQNSVVWLPTWEQALEILRQHGGFDVSTWQSPEDYERVSLYRRLGFHLAQSGAFEAPSFLPV